MEATAPTPESVVDADLLRVACRGAVHVPGDDGYDAARMAFNVTVDQRPAVVVEAAEAEDVAAAVRFAVARGLKVTAQAGGHGARHEATMRDTVCIRTNRMRGITIDVANQTARVGAGVRWGDLSPLLGEYGLVGLSGSAADVGIVGYSLSGGVSWFGRRYGYSANNVVSVELIDARGDARTVTAQSDPELFWALRGGGGNFGIVTAITIELKHAPELFGGQVCFPVERAGAVMRAFRAAASRAGLESSLTCSITHVPPFPEIPEPIRGRSIVNVGLVHLGGGAEARELLAGVYAAGGEPLFDVMRPLLTADLGFVAMDPEEPLPYMLRASMLEDVDAGDIDRVVAVAGDPRSGLVMTQIRHLGGALARPAATHGAIGHLEGEFLLYGVAMVPAPELAAHADATLAALRDAVAAKATGRLPVTFAETGSTLREAIGGQTYDRLEAIKAERDPDGVFAANHPIAA